ncbi:MAG: DUF3291 domain-containing protein [Sulfitobacter sp.]
MTHVVAFSSFSIMKKPYGNPVVAGFEALTPPVFAAAEKSPGFIDRARETDDLDHLGNFERDWGAWGKFVVPDYYDGGFEIATETRAGTLSLWEDVESVFRFTYGGLHRRAFDQREKWFREIDYPTHVVWWVPRGTIPTWGDSVERYEHLAKNGPDSFAFNFRTTFDHKGNATPAPKME